MVFSVVVLTLLLASTAWCLLTRDRIAAACLVVVAAVWFPANNRHLEGRTLLVVGTTHGITVADLIGLAGWLLGTAVLVVAELPDRYRSRGSGDRALIVFGGCLAALVAGAAVAYATG
jgi:hypothetical protein